MATDPREATLKLLTSIDTTLKAILLVLSEGRNANPAALAPTVDLDGPKGNPVVKAKSPRDWSGDDMTGRPFSECPPEYLDLVAERLDYFSTQLGDTDEDKKKRKYNALDAARARGWSARLRAGWTAPTTGRVDEANGEPQW